MYKMYNIQKDIYKQKGNLQVNIQKLMSEIHQ